MSEHMFGAGSGEISKREMARANRIAADYGCGFTCVRVPGQGWRHWFAGPNRGNPQDREMEREVLAAVGRIKIKIKAAK